MRRVRLAVILGLAPVLAGLAALAGCGGGDKGKDMPQGQVTESGGGGGGSEKKVAAKEEELASTGWGTLKGKVKFAGDPPARAQLDITKDKDYCLKGDTKDQTWKVGADKGVANVVVWLRAPKGKYFKVPDDEKKVAEPAVIDQPFCAFVPHVQVLYPSYFDGKKQRETGQKLEIRNSASITHNTNYEPSNPTLNQGGNPILQSKEEKTVLFKASPDNRSGGEQQVKFACNIHTWMRGYARVFDHPYADVTSGDKGGESGNYEIKKAPAGAEVELVYWHESFPSAEGKVLKKITLKEGDNEPVDFEIK